MILSFQTIRRLYFLKPPMLYYKPYVRMIANERDFKIMKHLLLLGTGGTIACKRGENGLTPLLTGDELLSYVPDAKNSVRWRRSRS